MEAAGVAKEAFGSNWSPTGAPTTSVVQPKPGDHSWGSGGRRFDNSVNAVSFGFVATAILISMFLVMAIFERFLRPAASQGSPPQLAGGRTRRRDIESQALSGKLGYPSPKMTVYGNGVSVLMPGDNFPTFIARPAPVPCPPERVSWSQHQHHISLPDLNPRPS